MDQDWTISWVDQNGAWRPGEPPAGWLQGNDGRWWPPTRSPIDGFVTSPRSGPATPLAFRAGTTSGSLWTRSGLPAPTSSPSPPSTVEMPVLPLPPLPAAVPPGADRPPEGAVAGATGPGGLPTWAKVCGATSVVVLVVALLAVTAGGAGPDAETVTRADTETGGAAATSAPTTSVPLSTTTAPTTTTAPPPPTTTPPPPPSPVVTAPPATPPNPSPAQGGPDGPGGPYGPDGPYGPGGPYADCEAARAAGAAPVHAGDSGYARHLDRDGDGVGCDS